MKIERVLWEKKKKRNYEWMLMWIFVCAVGDVCGSQAKRKRKKYNISLTGHRLKWRRNWNGHTNVQGVMKCPFGHCDRRAQWICMRCADCDSMKENDSKTTATWNPFSIRWYNWQNLQIETEVRLKMLLLFYIKIWCLHKVVWCTKIEWRVTCQPNLQAEECKQNNFD